MEIGRSGGNRRTFRGSLDVLEDTARVVGEVDARGSNGEKRGVGGRGNGAVVMEQGPKPMVHGVVGVEKSELSIGEALEVAPRVLGEAVGVLEGIRVHLVGHKGSRPIQILKEGA